MRIFCRTTVGKVDQDGVGEATELLISFLRTVDIAVNFGREVMLISASIVVLCSKSIEVVK